jgi:hypothetical protein
MNSKKKAPKQKVIKDYYIPIDNNDPTPVFESRFESGNLHSAFRSEEPLTYQLILQNDSNTLGYSQWFFFRIGNTKKGTKIRFNIINLLKPKSLYCDGAKIVTYSEKKAELENIGWHRSCENITYYKNSLYKFINDKRRNLYTLSFTYEVTHDDDYVYFANTIPYTYTELMSQLNEIERNDKKYDFVYRKTLCTTLAGNNLDYFTLTSNMGKSSNFENKKAIIIMARVHPGETVSSWIMDGIIELLVGDSEEAKYLRENFIFKVIPMLNPDGVIVGNYRTSLAGCDLNRRWHNPSQTLHPEIFYAKEMILKTSAQMKMGLIVDLHGHSNAYNIFMYGNMIKEAPLVCKQFPYILSKLSNLFSFNQCSFKMQANKKGTGRINLFNELNSLPNIFTLEASFCGGNMQDDKLYYNLSNLKAMGKDFCRSIISYFVTYEGLELKAESLLSFKMNKDAINTVLRESENKIVEIIKEDETHPVNENMSDSDGSDSEPSGDNLDVEELAKLLPSTNKRMKKSKILFNLEKNKPTVMYNKNNRNKRDSSDIVSTNVNLTANGNKVMINTTTINSTSPHVRKQENRSSVLKNVEYPRHGHHRSTSISKPTLLNNINIANDSTNNTNNSINLTIKQNIISTQQSNLNKTLNITKTKLTLDIKTVNPMLGLGISKKDAETQTEEIFFKM